MSTRLKEVYFSMKSGMSTHLRQVYFNMKIGMFTHLKRVYINMKFANAHPFKRSILQYVIWNVQRPATLSFDNQQYIVMIHTPHPHPPTTHQSTKVILKKKKKWNKQRLGAGGGVCGRSRKWAVFMWFARSGGPCRKASCRVWLWVQWVHCRFHHCPVSLSRHRGLRQPCAVVFCKRQTTVGRTDICFTLSGLCFTLPGLCFTPWSLIYSLVFVQLSLFLLLLSLLLVLLSLACVLLPGLLFFSFFSFFLFFSPWSLCYSP